MDSSSDLVGIDVPKSVDIAFEKEESEMKHTTYSVDIAKNVFEIAVSYEAGVVRESHRVARVKFLEFFAKREKGTVVMEACGSSHFWARAKASASLQSLLKARAFESLAVVAAGRGVGRFLPGTAWLRRSSIREVSR